MPQENKQWFVIYTRSRAEKKVKEELIAKHIDCFLPMQKQLRQWKDRKKWVETPLISGYCFVHITRKDYDSVLQSPNVVCYVTFEGRAAVIPEQQILFLKQLLKQYDFDVQVSHDNFIQGEKVEIVEGPLVGMRGELIDNRGKNKFLLRIEQLETSFLVEIPAVFLSALPKNSV
ncbi:UpxY family transcription antiterminator [uncultured Draconibacterium sp.]|uniref:UpxY family transcription antiterminator n=1 Tax=uncultured Draconibacterium sp. TaxID=1573823 RepID=UPI003217DF66